MAEILFSKEEYDSNISNMTIANDGINVFLGEDVLIRSNSSDAITGFYDTYIMLRDMVQAYSWSLDSIIPSLQSAGNAIFDTDQNIKDSI